MSASRFRKKPVVIEAMQWTGRNLDAVQSFVGRMQNMDGDIDVPIVLPPRARDDDGDEVFLSPLAHLWVEANRSWLPLDVGEWIIRDARGFYPCKPDIFASTYEPA